MNKNLLIQIWRDPPDSIQISCYSLRENTFFAQLEYFILTLKKDRLFHPMKSYLRNDINWFNQRQNHSSLCHHYKHTFAYTVSQQTYRLSSQKVNCSTLHPILIHTHRAWFPFSLEQITTLKVSISFHTIFKEELKRFYII